MRVPITFIHQRGSIDTMSKREQSALLDKLIEANIDLYPNEEKLLNKKQEKKYVNIKLKRERHLNAKEFNATDNLQKYFYLGDGMRLDGTDIEFFKNINKEWRDEFLSFWLGAGKALSKEFFDVLTIKEKKYYCAKHLMNTAYFEDYEIQYLGVENQKKVIDQLFSKNEAMSTSQIKALTKDNQKYYKKMLKQRLSEQKVRKLIRTTLLENSQ